MPKSSTTIEIDASCDRVFDKIHDYSDRLSRDTLLQEARILGDDDLPGVGVRTRCTGKRRVGGIALETEYVSFQPGVVAAVKLVNRPPLFEHFAATIRHQALDTNRSRVTYNLSFRARPHVLAVLLEPIMQLALRRETRNRLHALRRALEADGKVIQ